MSLLNSIPDAAIEDKEMFEEEFLDFLRELDYPEDSIFRGPAFNLKLTRKWKARLQEALGGEGVSLRNDLLSCYADLAILELDTCRYAALIEFRLRADEETKSRIATLFQAVLECAEIRPPAFLVTPGRNGGFRIFQLRENEHWQELPAKHFPHYTTIAAGYAAEKSLNPGFRHERNMRRFTLACRALAGFLALVVCSSIVGLTALTVGQICLMITISILLMAPESFGFRSVASNGLGKFLRMK